MIMDGRCVSRGTRSDDASEQEQPRKTNNRMRYRTLTDSQEEQQWKGSNPVSKEGICEFETAASQHYGKRAHKWVFVFAWTAVGCIFFESTIDRAFIAGRSIYFKIQIPKIVFGFSLWLLQAASVV